MDDTFAVKAETYEGAVMMLRGGFHSHAAAESHPVQMKLWKRVWVEKVKAARPISNSLPPLPWSYQTSATASANGAFHAYLVDATGRKIAALWGKGREKELMAEAILAALNPLEPTL